MINSINSSSSGYLNQLSNNNTLNLIISAATKTENNQKISDAYETSTVSSDSTNSLNEMSFQEYMELMKSNTAQIMSTKEELTAQAGDISSIDADGDGTISADEYETMISQMGINDAVSADDFFAQYDTDNDGELTSEEYCAKDSNRMPPPPMGPPPQEALGISDFDTDGDGTLSSDEYENIISQLGIEDALSADDFFSTYDTNQDGELSSDELEAMSESLNDSINMETLASNTIKAYETNYQYMFESTENTNLNRIV